MKTYFGLIVLVLILGFILFPSVHISGSLAIAIPGELRRSRQQNEAGQFAPAATIFTVNSTGDTPDALPGDGVCNDGTGNCTLRAAIMESNALAGADTINFNIAPAGSKTISFGSPLPQIIDTVTINGTTQGGFAGTPIIELRGNGIAPPLLVVQASNCTLRGLVVNRVDGNAIALIGDKNRVVGNFIGTDLSGTASGPGNAGAGVAVSGSGNAIGGTAAGDPNIIAFNNSGVSVTGGSANSILSNSISANAALGIDLNGDGVTPNDPPVECDADLGPNGLQNFPVLTGAQTTGAIVSIQGTLNSKASSTYRIEFFANANCDPSGFGEGEKFIGSTTVMTNAACTATFNVNFAVPVPAGQSVTATATDPANNTSEFSQCVTVIATTCTISCPGNITRVNDPNQCGATVDYPAPTTSGACGAVTCNPAMGTFFAKGTTTVTCTTSAGPGCSFTVTVNDAQPPTITCPANITKSTDPNQCSAVITYPPPMASDNCPMVSTACNPPSGSSFPKGTTNVNCTATDTSGLTANCTFTVTINDTQNPTITCPSNVNTTTANPAGTTVNYPPPTASDNCPGVTTNCNPPSGSNFPIGTTTVTCNATDTSANSATCTFTVTVTLVACTITCPANLTRTNDANKCSAKVDYPPPTTTGTCGTVTCTPPAGSVFDIGTTTVDCVTGAGPSCSFNVTVIDNTPPVVTCPGAVVTPLPPGQTSAVVNYPAATVTDNCPGASVQCSPPSGSRFPAGTTFVNCVATDAFSNSATCFFRVTVLDTESPVIRCPANVSVVPPTGQTSAVVNYPPPTVTDNLPGVRLACSPASGSSFPLGVTTVTCTATDVAGNKSSCSFTVSIGGPQATVIIPAGKPAVEFGNPTAISPTRKPKKAKNNPCQLFAVGNIGFAPLVLTFDSIARTGSDVGTRIIDPNDLRYFSLSLVNPDQSLTPIDIGAVMTVQPSGTQNFCLRFNALIPATAGKSTGLAAADVLPATMTSRVTFRQNAGSPISVPVLSHVATGLVLIDPTNPRKPPVVSFTRSGNDIIVSYAVFDANLDVSRAKYEFLDSAGNVVGESFEINLAESVRALNLLPGQSFSVEQRFTNASSHPEITGVRLTVFDGETSVSNSSLASSSTASSASIQLLNPARGATLYLPDVMLGPLSNQAPENWSRRR